LGTTRLARESRAALQEWRRHMPGVNARDFALAAALRSTLLSAPFTIRYPSTLVGGERHVAAISRARGVQRCRCQRSMIEAERP
jgi:ABC-type dipeptide/oligopeptide/nickel transport system ATPase subunit